MNEEYYPWGGDFTPCNPKGCVAVVLLNIEYTPPENVAIYGSLKTENIGIEKIVANVISNPHIRYVIVCGNDIRGHRSGTSLLMLHKNGIDEHHRIIEAPGAIPYIENLDEEAIQRFRDQVEMVNLVNVVEKTVVDETIAEYVKKNPGVYGKPYIAIRITSTAKTVLDDKRALHSKIVLDYLGRVKKRE